MEQDGTRASQQNGRPVEASRPATLSDIGLTRDQSSKWQKLAAIPDEKFESALSEVKMPTTDGLLHNTRGTQGTGDTIKAHSLRPQFAHAVDGAAPSPSFWVIL
jgi:hypothetical protein